VVWELRPQKLVSSANYTAMIRLQESKTRFRNSRQRRDAARGVSLNATNQCSAKFSYDVNHRNAPERAPVRYANVNKHAAISTYNYTTQSQE